MINKAFLLTSLILFLLSFTETTQAQRKRQSVKKPKKTASVSVQAYLEPEIDTKNLSERQKLRLESFRTVWQTINDYYFDPKFNGLDWRKLKYENELKVIKSETDDEFYKILKGLIARLNASHFEIIPPEFLQEINRLKSEADKTVEDDETEDADEPESAEAEEKEIAELLKSLEEYDSLYGVGADVKFFGTNLIVTHVDKNSAAEKAGLKLGYKIEKINGVSIDDIISRLKTIENFEKTLKQDVPIYIKTFLFGGEKDSSVSIVYSDGQSATKELTFKREKLDGELIYMSEHLPRQFLEFETKSLNEEIGYVRFNIFTVSSAEKFCRAITEFRSKKSLVVDLRGNMGGLIGAIYGIGGLLTDKPMPMGNEITRRGEVAHVISPHLKNFKGKIVVLTDDSSLSAAEILTSVLQENGRATVLGETTGGEALPSLSKVLPNGAVFQYPVANYKTFKGKFIEGAGVKPDIEIKLDRSKLLSGTDNQLDEAIRFLQKNLSNDVKIVAQNQPKSPPPSPPAPAAKSRKVEKTAIKEEYDPAALVVIEKYVKAIGGAEAWKNLKTLRATGSAVISKMGATTEGEIELTRKFPNKANEAFYFTGVGDINEIFDGEKFFVQMQFTGAQTIDSPTKIAELKLEKDFLELVNLRGNYKNVKFLGNFERSGKRVNLIQVKNAEDNGFVLAFDAATNLLVHRSGAATEISYDDYRKIGDYLLPHKISKDWTIEIEFDEIEVNAEVGDEDFAGKLSCFDKID